MSRAARYLLPVAGLLSAIYAIHVLVDIARPRVNYDDPVIGLLGPVGPAAIRVTFWAVLAGWLLIAAGWAAAAGWRHRTGRDAVDPSRLRVATAAVLLLPFAILPASIALGHPLILLICLPSTAFGLLVVYSLQRYRRVPVGLLLAVFGWGALIATGFGGANNLWVLEYAPRYLADFGDAGQTRANVNTALFASSAVFEELGKGAGVALAYLLFRRHIDGVVAGVVLGAAAGLGFNLVETVEYVAASPVAAGFQFWMRQSVGLMGAHTAFAALVGAGFGLARTLRTTRAQVTAIAAGYVAAVGGHFANNAVLQWWTASAPRSFTDAHPVLDQVVVQPLVLILLQGPFVLMYLLLVRTGLRDQATGLGHALRAEAGAGLGTVSADEVSVLLNPARRLWMRFTTLRRYGWAARRALVRLQDTQYALAARLAQDARGDRPAGPPATELRPRALSARAELRERVHAETPAGKP